MRTKNNSGLRLPDVCEKVYSVKARGERWAAAERRRYGAEDAGTLPSSAPKDTGPVGDVPG
jgi:hypothetical protein